MNTTSRIITVEDLIQQTYQILEQFQYSKEYLKKFDYSFSLFKQYALKNEITFYNEQLAFAFLEEYCELFSNKDSTRYVYQERKRAIAKLDEMYKYNKNSITNNNPRERRDYAMLLLAARVGLRSSDIINLKFSNINWEKNEINLVQQKTKTPLTLPLLKDVGEAIINYIKNGRPNIEDQHIFIREAKPYMKLSSSSLYMIVDGYLKRAKIKIPTGKKHGPHALRHSLATLLLENNIPISTIKEILAHQSTETTKIYLKVSEKQLLQCALDVTEIDNKSSFKGKLHE